MKRVCVVMPSCSQIEITGSFLRVETFEYDPETDMTTVSSLAPEFQTLEEVGLTEQQNPDGTWRKLVGRPAPRRGRMPSQ